MVRYKLFDDRAPEEIRKRYEDATSKLTKYAKGVMVLSGVTPATDNGIIAAEPQAPNVKHIGTITNQWLIWVVARSSRGQRNSGDGIRELADPVLERVIESLMGQKLLKEYEALTITDTIPPAYGDGFGYFPLAFNARKTVRGK